MSEIEELKNFLEKVPAGSISVTDKLEPLLAAAWPVFDGGDETSMAAHKISERIERVEWKPPEISFSIERHGGTVLGSTRAEMQRWTLNLDERTASSWIEGHRQIRPMNKSLDVAPIAKRVVRTILKGDEADFLKWRDVNRVRVIVAKIIPGKLLPKQTVEGRRRRFREKLTSLLVPHGWRRPTPLSIYVKEDGADAPSEVE